MNTFSRAVTAKILALALLALLAVPQTSLAQGRSSIGVQHEVAASLGPLHQAALQEAARLAAMRSVSPAQAQPPERSWRSRHPVLMGALVGAGAGGGITMLTCRVMSNEPGIVSCYNWVPILAGVGSGIGAVVGLMH
jgi:hypothetical protein